MSSLTAKVCKISDGPENEKPQPEVTGAKSAAMDHVAHLRAINVTPHVTQNDSITATGKRRQSAIDRRTTRHEGYGMSQSCRAMIECIFGWGKQHGTMRKTKHRGLASVLPTSCSI